MLFIDCPTEITLTCLLNHDTGAIVSDATPSVTITDDDGNTITTFALTALGNGNYSGTIAPSITATLEPSAEYLVAISTTLDSSIIDYRQELHVAVHRGFNE